MHWCTATAAALDVTRLVRGEVIEAYSRNSSTARDRPVRPGQARRPAKRPRSKATVNGVGINVTAESSSSTAPSDRTNARGRCAPRACVPLGPSIGALAPLGPPVTRQTIASEVRWASRASKIN